MGEKGNALQGIATAAAAAEGSTTFIETMTSTASETVVGVGGDLVGTIKDKSIGAVADTTIAAARGRLHRRPADDFESTGEPQDPAAILDALPPRPAEPAGPANAPPLSDEPDSASPPAG